PGEEITAEELLPLLEPERVADTADREILDATVMQASSALDGALADVAINGSVFADAEENAASASVEKPSFETFLSSPVTLGDYLRSQLSVTLMSDEVRDAAESIIGNLDD